jgi:hypothetical protein
MTPTIITFPTVAIPQQVNWTLERMDGRFTSPLAGTFQDIVRPGARWRCEMSWKTLNYDDSQALMAWSAQMAKGGVRTALPNYAYKARGSLAGTPLVNGGSQVGNTLLTKGWTASAASVLKPGDLFQITNGTLHQLVMVTGTANINADGSGDASVPIESSLRFSPTDASALVVSAPPAYFAFAKPSATAAYTPPRFASMSLALIEDIQL